MTPQSARGRPAIMPGKARPLELMKKIPIQNADNVPLTAAARPVIPIVATVDDHFVLPLAVMLYSLLEHSGHRYGYTVYVIDSGVSEDAKRAVEVALSRHAVPITWLPISRDFFGDLPLVDRARSQMYHVLSIGDLLPDDCGKVLFLDADLLVLDDIEQLWEVELHGNMIAAVQDMAVPTVSSPMGLARYRQLCLPPSHRYFNAGVMAVDLRQWREQKIGAKVIDYVKANRGSIGLQQQDGLNAVLARSWFALELRWNVIAGIAGRRFFKAMQLETDEYSRAVNAPAIVHYAGHFKPWEIETGDRFATTYRQSLLSQNWVPWNQRASLRNKLMSFYDRRLRSFLYSVEHRWWTRRYRPA